MTEVFTRRKVEGNVEGWLLRKQELTQQLLTDSPRLYRGVETLVNRLYLAGYRLGVVTTTWRANVDAAIRSSGMAQAFEFVIAKEDVAATKPDPEGYRKALERLALDPSEVVAIEDSPTGLQAAMGGGLRAIAVGHRRPEGAWTEGAAFLPSLRDTEGVIAAIDPSVKP